MSLGLESTLSSDGHTVYERKTLGRQNRKIFKAAAYVTIASALVKAAATLKELVVARQFGRGDATDAFLIAFLLPGLLVNLFSESMNQALIPTFVRVQKELGLEKAQQLLSSALTASVTLSVIGSLVIAAGARIFIPLLTANFAPSKQAFTEYLFYGLLPLVVLAGVASICTAVLNTVERFALPALAPIVIPLLISLGAWMFAHQSGIWILVYSNLAGSVIHTTWAIRMMQLRGYPFRLVWYGRVAAIQPAIGEIMGQYGPVLLSGLVSSAGLLIDQGMAATLPAGSVSSLAYASRFVSVILTLLAGAIATALTPYLSAMVARCDWDACRHAINSCVAVAAAVSIPVAIAIIFGSSALVKLAFQHGAFAASDTSHVAPVQAMYAIQVPFFVVSRIFYRYLVAIRKTSLILYCGIINLLLDIILNLVLMRWMGVAGIALATSLWTVSTFLFLSFWAYRLLPAPSHRFPCADPR